MKANVSATRMPLLFARYVAGQISEQTWRALTDIIDTFDASDERAALVDFLNDAIDDLGIDALKLPRRSEVESVAGNLRWAA